MTFDRYIDNSTKSGTRKNRSRKARPIRKIVDGRTVPLPQNWNDFQAVPANKQDLTLLLSNELIAQAPGEKIIVVAGGFRTAEDTQCTQPFVDIEMPTTRKPTPGWCYTAFMLRLKTSLWQHETPTFCCYFLHSSPV